MHGRGHQIWFRRQHWFLFHVLAPTKTILCLIASIAILGLSLAVRAAEPPHLVFDHRVQVAVEPDGRLVLFTTRQAVSGTELLRSTSADGIHWSDPVLVRGAADWQMGAPLVTQDGEIHFFITKLRTEGERRFIDVWHARSFDGRRRWSEPKRMFEGYVGALMGAVELRSGRILVPFAYGDLDRSWSTPAEGFDAFTYLGQHTTTVYYSDDGGATWHKSNDLKVQTPDLHTLGAIEPVVVEVPGRGVYMLIRTQLGRFYESVSADGSAWSRPVPGLRSSDSPAGLARLPDGRLVLLWNNSARYAYAYGGRQVLHGAVSNDGARTWRGFREVYRDPLRNEAAPSWGDHGTAYPIARATPGGKVFFTTGQGKSSVSMVLDPDWLLETEQRDDFTHGLDGWSVYGTRGVELVAHPTRKGAHVLALRKPEASWPSAAVWNFPSGAKGRLGMKLWLEPEFHGATISLTDHYSVPFDPEAEIHAVFNFPISPDGRIGTRRFRRGVFHAVTLEWNLESGKCRISVDGRTAGDLELSRAAEGVSYLRLRSSAAETDPAGLRLESVEANVITP